MKQHHLLFFLLAITNINYSCAMIREFTYEPITQTNEWQHVRRYIDLWIKNIIPKEDIKNFIIFKRKATEEEQKGTCIRYAINTITKSKAPINLYIGAITNIDIEKFFVQTNYPKTNDLVIYTINQDNPQMKHFAIFINEEIFESKLGHEKNIIQHSIFGLPTSYGNTASFWTLKEKFNSEEGKKILPKEIEKNVDSLEDKYGTRQYTIKTIIGGAIGIGLGKALSNFIIELLSNNK